MTFDGSISPLDAAVPCGADRCRVCRALGFGWQPAPHHPLKAPGAVDRANKIHAFMLAYQGKHDEPPTAKQIALAVGLSHSAGLIALYMRKLEQEGRAKRRDRRRPSWEAVA